MIQRAFRDPRFIGGMAMLVSFGAAVNIQYNSFLFEARGLGPAQVGYLNALGNFAALFSPLVAGWWADRSGRPRMVLAFYGMAASVLLFLLPQARGPVALSITFLAFQVMFLPFFPLAQSLVLSRAGGGQGRFLALRAMGTLGFALLSMAFTGWVTTERLGGAYAWMATCLCASLPFFFCLPGKEGPAQNKSFSLGQAIATIWTRPLRGIYLVGAVGFFSSSMGMSVLGNHITGTLKGKPADISRAWTLSTVLEIGFMFLAIPLLRRWGLKTLVMIGFLSMVVRWLMAGLALNLHHLYVAQIFHGVMVAGLYTGQQMYLAKLLPSSRLASGMAAASLLNGGVASTLGSALAGGIWQVAGLRMVYLTTAGVALMGAILFWKLVPELPLESAQDVVLGPD